MYWRETAVSMSEKIFPELQNVDFNRKEHDEFVLSKEVFSNLPLQMALYFNVIFFPVWFILLVIFIYSHYTIFNEIYQIITIALLIILTLVEVMRLYCGYDGNLRDKVPELAAFWMLSILLQFPLQTFVLFQPFVSWHPFQTIAQSIMFTLLLMQLFFGYFALKNVSAHQITCYRILKLRSDVAVIDKQRRYKAD